MGAAVGAAVGAARETGGLLRLCGPRGRRVRDLLEPIEDWLHTRGSSSRLLARPVAGRWPASSPYHLDLSVTDWEGTGRDTTTQHHDIMDSPR